MEQDLLPVQPDFKLYTDKAVLVGTFVGGPLVAGYLAAENYRHLGQRDNAAKAWIISILTTVIIFGIIFLVPNIQKMPSYVIPLAYTFTARYLVRTFQGPAILTHIEQGGPIYSIWRALWIGLVGLVILFVILFAIILIADPDMLR